MAWVVFRRIQRGLCLRWMLCRNTGILSWVKVTYLQQRPMWYKMCVSFQLSWFFISVISISVCSTSSEFHLIALELLSSFIAIFSLLEFWGIVSLLCLCFALFSWPLLKLMFPFATHQRGWCPHLTVCPLTPFFPCCWAQKKLEWKGRSASKLINDNLITFLPTWNSQTTVLTPACQPKKKEIYRKI